MVRPDRAASRRSRAMTVSSILRVVFIWLTIPLVCLYGKPFASDIVSSSRPAEGFQSRLETGFDRRLLLF